MVLLLLVDGPIVCFAGELRGLFDSNASVDGRRSLPKLRVSFRYFFGSSGKWYYYNVPLIFD